MSFNLWSELNKDAKEALKPNLGYRTWDTLSQDEKKKIWRYLELHFFNENMQGSGFYSNVEEHFEFPGNNEEYLRKRIDYSIDWMNYLYKAKNFTKNFLNEGSHLSACKDFYSIFINEEGNAVLELISLYCRATLKEKEHQFFRFKQNDETDQDFEQKKKEWEIDPFNGFAADLNDVFGDFGLNVYLSINGFIPKQEDKLTVEIYEPVIKCLSDIKWKKVNELLSDAFKKYTENTPSGYSTCVTHTVAAVEAFLQLKVKGKTGEGDFAGLVSEGQRKGLIPDDMFTKDIFKTIISILMRERKETGDAHVKESYATERNAKMVLNLAMVFIQHCILN